MPKFTSILQNFCALILFVFLFFAPDAFAQSDGLQNDLRNSFQKFDIVRLDAQDALRRVENRRTLSISTAEKNFELILTPRDLRSPRYRAEDTGANGVRAIEKGALTTFRGSIAGEMDSEVRLTIDGAKIEGYFNSNGEMFFIEPARKYSRGASAEDFVIYREKDLVSSESFTCHSEILEKIERGKKMVGGDAANSINTLRVLEIATEADFQYVSVTGGASATNNEILNILNMTEGVFESELGLTIQVVFQHTWSTQDPFDGTNPNTLLTSFRNHWNANFSGVQRDTAHLWTAKPNTLSQGFAYVSVICNNPGAAYGFSGRVEWNSAKFLITTHEVGHNLGANHADTPQSCDNTIMNTTLSVVTPLTFCTFSRSEINNFVGANGSCLDMQSSAGATRFDFDGDRKADVAVFRPSNGVWYIANSGGGFNIFQFGLLGDKPVAADYDGDGKTDAAVYRSGVWYRLKSSNNTADVIAFGLPTDIPAPADFEGDGRADVAVYRPSNGVWHFLNSSNNAYSSVQFGVNGDVPVAADYDADGRADINVWRPSTGVWYRLNSTNGAFFYYQFGLNGDKPVAGDFDGDGRADLAVWRPSNGVWYALYSSNGSLFAVAFGMNGDVPAPADYDGDGKTDANIFRPSNGVWYRLNSSNGAYSTMQFGVGSDIPVESYYIP